ncbi:uncharacterized protein PGTG_01831 [Puccinia graminis f. sp. tritici CRL 75-36-700-3]|uniref:Uncharacterized protein n=1 Tax=Puccinia graminis f. sp. tritici (strain CRL 75-36-700-3 / race SCCL) TaxID=418459 RepID=E3JT11_PUCGT|nr:uncharacterized protein PGTG_01831 [Puccinia graminis f. sp. tritici CRL 75-36-700-3]EFP75238.1 hypothetical protein PGTG_01831 [Puccinia graminis f. sp. tritici CRL 75-36-700-3]
MLIRVDPRAIWLLALCCSDATSLLGGNWGEIEIDGQVFNKRIILPGVELDEGINVSEKEREVLEYMATVPELHRQQSYLKPTEDSYPVRHKPSRIVEESQISSMRDDFLLIKEDLANLQEGKSVNGIPEKLEETCSWELEIGKFQTQLDTLKKILSFISLAIQRKLFRRRDELEEIESHIPKVLAKELAELLEKIASFDSRKESKKSNIETVIALRLQSIVFQALNFLYIYHFVDEGVVQALFESNKNFLLAITNMVLMFKINVGFDKYIPTSVQEILRSSHSSHFRSLFGEQDLQNRHSSKLGMPVFKLTNEGPIEGQIRKELQDLKNHFLKPGPAIKDDINLKIQCLILTWIEDNYREFFLDLQRNNSSLKPKLSLLNVYTHLIYEFKYVVEYLKLFVLRMDGSQFPGFKYRQLSKHIPRDLHGALQFIKMVSNYILLVAFKHNQYIKDFVHNPLMEKYLQIENLNKYIFFPQFCIAVAKDKLDSLLSK